MAMLTRQDLEFRAQLWNDVTEKIRYFFRARDYHEVSTPLLVRSPGMEPNLYPLGIDIHTDGPQSRTTRMGLITSPEYSMKKLLGSGMERIFTLSPVFRDHEFPGQRWSIEFTMLEWYCQGADYRELMNETAALVNEVVNRHDVWQRISYVDEFERIIGFVPYEHDAERLRHAGDKFHLAPSQAFEPVHEMIDRLFYAVVWPQIKRSERYMLCEFPLPCASLARVSADGRYAERFEAFVGELELCNGFTELTDAPEQRRRFLMEAEERRLAGKEVFPIDDELLSRLPSLASPTYGNALGVDRLVMLAAGVQDIDSIHLFPPSQRY